MRRKVYKFSAILLGTILSLLSITGLVSAKAMSYNYDFFKNVIPSAEGLAHDLTYYSSTIKPANPGQTGTVMMDGLSDMEVYGNKIYLLNYSKTGTEFVLHPETVDAEGNVVKEVKMNMTNVGQITVLNESFEWEEIVNEFPFSQKVVNEQTGETIEDRLVNYLDNYYSFTTPLDKITVAQVNSDDLLVHAPYVPYTKDYLRHAIRLRSPEGITVTENGIYVADTVNCQIVQLEKNENTGVYEVVNLFLTPDDATFYQVSCGVSIDESAENGTLFRPLKVAVDVSGRVYCIARNVYEGIIEFARAKEETRIGLFNRFLGKNDVVANPLKAFWAKIFSDTQLGSMTLDLPPMFTNITMDSEGFLYATSLPDKDAEAGTTQANMVKAINTAGKDVMKRNGYVTPNGDATYVITTNETNVVTGPSTLTGVAINNKKGIFTVIDSKRGRLFTYDMEGNLLYITGEQPGGSTSQGSSESRTYILVNPVAVDYFTREYIDENGETQTEDLVLVLDSASMSLVVFRTTEFGEYVNEATACYQLGNIEDAEVYWREVIKINTNYELAYLGIGKSVLRGASTIEQYKEAMELFERSHNATYYSKAYSLYRDAQMRKYFAPMMTAVLVIIVAVVGISVYKRIKKKKMGTLPKDNGGDE